MTGLTGFSSVHARTREKYREVRKQIYGAKENDPKTRQTHQGWQRAGDNAGTGSPVATIQKLFADNADTTSVVSRADDCPELAAVIEAVLPGCQRRSRRHYPVVTLRNVLMNLAEQHFVIDEYGWWRIPGRSI